MNAVETKLAMDESKDETKRYQSNAAYVPSDITPSTFVTFIWDNCNHNCASIFGDTLYGMNGKEISSYARVELTHEAVSAVENTTKMRAFRPLEKKATTTLLVKRKETERMAGVELEDVHIEASCSSQRENQLYQLLHYLSSLKDEQKVVPV